MSIRTLQSARVEWLFVEEPAFETESTKAAFKMPECCSNDSKRELSWALAAWLSIREIDCWCCWWLAILFLAGADPPISLKKSNWSCLFWCWSTTPETRSEAAVQEDADEDDEMTLRFMWLLDDDEADDEATFAVVPPPFPFPLPPFKKSLFILIVDLY